MASSATINEKFATKLYKLCSLSKHFYLTEIFSSDGCVFFDVQNHVFFHYHVAYSVLVYTFPVITEALGEYVPFLVYAVICIIGFMFIFLKLLFLIVLTILDH